MSVILLRVDTEQDNPEEIILLIKTIFKNNNTPVNTQSTLTNNNKDPPVKKYFCNNPTCKKEITKKEVAFCLFKDETTGQTRFNGKVYCRECQEAL